MSAGAGSVFQVGPGRAYPTLQQAIDASSPGDRIEVDAGVYEDQTATVRHSLTIVGVGGEAEFRWISDDSVPNDKGILLITGAAVDVHIENLAFVGGFTERSGNGAGIRIDANTPIETFTVVNSRFEGNQNGILGGAASDVDIVIRDSVFRDNGQPGRGTDVGRVHGLYMNGGDTLLVENSTFENNGSGHHIKSLAQESTIVRNSSLIDGAVPTSYAIDITAGGDVLIEDSQIVRNGVQGSNSAGAINYNNNRDGGVIDGVVLQNGQVVIRENMIALGRQNSSVVLAQDADAQIQLENNTIELTTSNAQLNGLVRGAATEVSSGNTLDGGVLPDVNAELIEPSVLDDTPPAPAVNLPALIFALGADTVALPDGDPSQAVDLGAQGTLIAKADVNGDGVTDLIFDTASGDDQILLSGDPAQAVPAGAANITLRSVADVNGDGQDDLVYESGAGGDRILLSGDPAQVRFLGEQGGLSAVGDVNGDGEDDLIYTYAAGGEHILLSGDPAQDRFLGLQGATLEAAVDVNGDGETDLLYENASNGGERIFLSGDVSDVVFLGQQGNFRAAGDFDGDGAADLLYQYNGGGHHVLFAGDIAQDVYLGVPGGDVRGVADVNGDGDDDLIVEFAGGGETLFLSGDPAQEVFLGQLGVYRGAEDVDGDGGADLVFELPNGNDVAVFGADLASPINLGDQGALASPAVSLGVGLGADLLFG